jgi:hypothetical protein
MWQPELLEVQKPPRKNDVRLFYHDIVGDENGGGSLVSTMVSFKRVTGMGLRYANNFHCQKGERRKEKDYYRHGNDRSYMNMRSQILRIDMSDESTRTAHDEKIMR